MRQFVLRQLFDYTVLPNTQNFSYFCEFSTKGKIIYLFRIYPCNYEKYPDQVFFIHFVLPLIFVVVKPSMTFLLSQRTFKQCEVQVEPQNQSVENDNIPEEGVTQKRNENQQEEGENNKKVIGTCQSKIIFVKPYESGQ